MPRTRAEIETALLAGQKVGAVQPLTVQQQRMFRFLLASPVRGTGAFTDEYIGALKKAFGDSFEAHEPVGTSVDGNGTDPTAKHCWRLSRIEAKNFGGVNAHHGHPFDLHLDGTSMCVEGYNGQGKTSLASVITVALTGQRISREGPTLGASQSAPVRHKLAERETGKWPPAVAYPKQHDILASSRPRAVARLTFSDGAGGEHVAETVISENGSAPTGIRLPPGVPEVLAEISVLMPNRIAHLRIGEDTRAVAVIVELLGLEPLRELGEHVVALCHGSKNFAGWPKTADIRKAEGECNTALVHLREVDASLLASIGLQAVLKPVSPGADLKAVLEAALNKLHDRKTELFAGVLGSVGPSLDLTKAADQTRVQKAVGRLQEKLDRKQIAALPSMALFKKLASLGQSEAGEMLLMAIETAEAELLRAEADHWRQQADRRLRLKAAAAEWHSDAHPDAESVDACPLCEQALTSDQTLLNLGAELFSLRQDAKRIRRTFDDSCVAIRASLDLVLQGLDVPLAVPDAPVEDFVFAFETHLRDDADLQLVLPVARSAALEVLAERAALIPAPPRRGEASAVGDRAELLLRRRIADAKHLAALIAWWPSAQPLLAALREATIGKPDAEGRFPSATLHAALQELSEVAAAVAPVDSAAQLVKGALKAVTALAELHVEREARGRIVSAIEPLKGLVAVAEDEARAAIANVSERTLKLFGGVYHGGDVGFAGVSINQKKALHADALIGDLVLDATLVANTSWLRAFLWAFVFSLRERLLEDLGYNPLPLLLLDDPQATFDECNERQWAMLLSGMAASNAPPNKAAQLFVTSYDPRLFDLMEQHGSYVGRRAAVHGIDPGTGCLRFIDGAAPDRAWNKFDRDRRPETAQEYIGQVRIAVEGCLGLILHAFGVPCRNSDINPLLQEFDSRKHQPFFQQKPIRALVDDLRSRGSFRSLLNDAHHAANCGRLGVRDADDVKKDWEKVKGLVAAAGAEVRRLQFMGPRAIPWHGSPASSSTWIRPAAIANDTILTTRGRVAAATDGRVSLGVEGGRQLRVTGCGAYRVLAEALAPVALIGDILLVRLAGEPTDGDLVIARIDGVLRARRIRWIPGEANCVLLLGATEGPTSAVTPIIATPPRGNMLVIKGVLYRRDVAAVGKSGSDEVEDLDNGIDLVASIGRGGSVWEVNGDSASPVALDGQHLVVGETTSIPDRLRRLDGEMVLAEVQAGTPEPEQYLKRLRWIPPLAVLESIDRSGAFPPVVCSVAEGMNLPRLQKAAAVTGVLFGSLGD